METKVHKNGVMDNTISNIGEIVLYQPDESIKLEVKLDDETVWLTQAQMAELFQTTKQNVSLHVNNIFKEGELERNVVVKDSLTTTPHGAIPKLEVKSIQPRKTKKNQSLPDGWLNLV